MPNMKDKRDRQVKEIREVKVAADHEHDFNRKFGTNGRLISQGACKTKGCNVQPWSGGSGIEYGPKDVSGLNNG